MRTTMVVTGGTGGIGRAVAEELTWQGHRVLTVGRGPAADLSLMRETALVANAGKYRDTLDLDDLQLRGGGRGLWLHETAGRAS